MIFQETMDGASQHAFAFSVDDSHFVNVFIDTRAEILIHHRGHLLGVECVEVQDPIDRDMDYVLILFHQIPMFHKSKFFPNLLGPENFQRAPWSGFHNPFLFPLPQQDLDHPAPLRNHVF